jgi:endoglycosylceramidase
MFARCSILILTVCFTLSGLALGEPGKLVTVKGDRFIDGEGRTLLLHGMSVISKSKQENYISAQTEKDFARMREMGMNCIRFGIIWDGVEPEPGKYDEKYLDKVVERVGWAAKYGIYVFLDMHQDLFSVKYSDGAPEWATLTGGAPHLAEGGIWSDAYFTSPAVQAAFDNFWDNKPAQDGVGVQDHFAAAWKHVAERFVGNPAVLGYDIFNEPNMGSESPQAQLLMVGRFGQLLQEKKGAGAPSALQIVDMWGTSDGRSKLMEYLKDMSIYSEAIGACEPVYANFEKTKLMPMYQRVADAIRKVDKDHILLLETSMASNMGVRSAIEPVLGPDGKRDPQQAYAPHGYDIVVDTPDQANPSYDRITLIFTRHGETAKRLGMPLLIGEWGAYGNAGPEIIPAARAVVREMEKLMCGNTYWAYTDGIEKTASFEVLCRPIPLCVSGILKSYGSDPETHTFTCAWSEDGSTKAVTEVFLPKAYYGDGKNVTLTPAGEIVAAPAGENGVLVSIKPTGAAGDRTLNVRP